MKARIVVVGSGASGVHFTLSLLQKGHRVAMFDVGRSGTPPVQPQANFSELKEQLSDPSAYFLGSNFDGVLLPNAEGEYYGVPPGKNYIFDASQEFSHSARGFSPLFSFGQVLLLLTYLAILAYATFHGLIRSRSLYLNETGDPRQARLCSGEHGDLCVFRQFPLFGAAARPRRSEFEP